MKFYKQKTEIQKAITLNFKKKNFYRTLIIDFHLFWCDIRIPYPKSMPRIINSLKYKMLPYRIQSVFYTFYTLLFA